MDNFHIIKAKHVSSMDKLSRNDIRLISEFLRSEDIVDPCEDYDFFDNDDWNAGDIRIIHWRWKDYRLIDIAGWPGVARATSLRYASFSGYAARSYERL